MAERITDENGFSFTPEEFNHQWGALKNPDEIVLENVKMFHYETMEEGRTVWMAIYLSDGRIYHLNIGGDNLRAYFAYEGP